jgi:AcrR family transcriptional regulator
MTKTGNAQPRPYHHGDLSRALVEAARRILERDGPEALSLRAVAREAGVSPAAPYHHFKDKNELFGAVAKQGWAALRDALAEAECESVQDAAIKTGLAYVRFATQNPALYRLMYDMARLRADLEDPDDEDSGFALVEKAIREAGGEIVDPTDLQLSIIAAWCASHGLAEMASFKRFDALKAEMGGEENFLKGVLQHIGALTHLTPHPA